MDLATQETAARLLNRAHQIFTDAMANGGRLDAAADMTQWIDDYDAVQPQLGQTAPVNESGSA
jgi:hypothetical protein